MVTKEITTETAHRLLYYKGKCAHVHGHSYRWRMTAGFDVRPHCIPRVQMGVDFGTLKEAMQIAIGQHYDHALVLHELDPLLKVPGIDAALSGSEDEPPRIVTTPFNPTAEQFARAGAIDVQTVLRQLLAKHLMETFACHNLEVLEQEFFIRNCRVVRAEVFETANSSAVWEESRDVK